MKIHRPKTNIPFSFLPARNFPDPTAFSIISTIAALALVARLGPFDHEAGCPGDRSMAAPEPTPAGRETLDAALRLAAEATYGWARYAKRDIEHREIARLHHAIAALRDGGDQ